MLEKALKIEEVKVLQITTELGKKYIYVNDSFIEVTTQH